MAELNTTQQKQRKYHALLPRVTRRIRNGAVYYVGWLVANSPGHWVLPNRTEPNRILGSSVLRKVGTDQFFQKIGTDEVQLRLVRFGSVPVPNRTNRPTPTSKKSATREGAPDSGRGCSAAGGRPSQGAPGVRSSGVRFLG